MSEHAAELLPLLLWLLSATGTALAAILTWLGAMVWRRLGEIAQSLRAIEKDLRADLSALDRRVSFIEGRCDNCKDIQP
jgi:hypothetical protein